MEDLTGYIIKFGSLEIAHPSLNERIIFLLFLSIVIFYIYAKYILNPKHPKK